MHKELKATTDRKIPLGKPKHIQHRIKINVQQGGCGLDLSNSEYLLMNTWWRIPSLTYLLHGAESFLRR
jgi:hypothetical protein